MSEDPYAHAGVRVRKGPGGRSAAAAVDPSEK